MLINNSRGSFSVRATHTERNRIIEVLEICEFLKYLPGEFGARADLVCDNLTWILNNLKSRAEAEEQSALVSQASE